MFSTIAGRATHTASAASTTSSRVASRVKILARVIRRRSPVSRQKQQSNSTTSPLPRSAQGAGFPGLAQPQAIGPIRLRFEGRVRAPDGHDMPLATVWEAIDDPPSSSRIPPIRSC